MTKRMALLARFTSCLAVVVSLAAPVPGQNPAGFEFLQKMKLPPGFSISLYADNIPGARMMAVSPNGDLFVSAMGSGSILVLQKDADGDGKPDGRSVYQHGLRMPHGLAFGGDDYFYFAEETSVSRIPYMAGDTRNHHRIQTIIRDLPAGGHSTKSIALDEKGKLYLSVGSSCNVCREKDKRRAAIVQYNTNGTGERLYSTGIRNAVGLAWHPVTKQLFATVNGRDMLGDDFPPDTLIRVTEGSFHGWPIANGDRVPDPEFGKGKEKEIAKMALPEVKFQAHSAPLGIDFYNPSPDAANRFPAEYLHDAFVAFHGSWNRSSKTGYKVVHVNFDKEGRATGTSDFVTGWLQGEEVHGRPVSCQTAPDGSLFVTDDMKGCVYRISYNGKK